MTIASESPSSTGSTGNVSASSIAAGPVKKKKAPSYSKGARPTMEGPRSRSCTMGLAPLVADGAHEWRGPDGRRRFRELVERHLRRTVLPDHERWHVRHRRHGQPRQQRAVHGACEPGAVRDGQLLPNRDLL